jgi:hypothetical protein
MVHALVAVLHSKSNRPICRQQMGRVNQGYSTATSCIPSNTHPNWYVWRRKNTLHIQSRCNHHVRHRPSMACQHLLLLNHPNIVAFLSRTQQMNVADNEGLTCDDESEAKCTISKYCTCNIEASTDGNKCIMCID